MTTVKQIERAVKGEGQVLTIAAEASVVEAARKMLDNEIGSLVVRNEHGTIVGILTERDVLNQVVAKARNPAGTTVARIMTHKLISCSLGTSIEKAERIMAEFHIRHLPVVEQGVPVGMISSRDVMAHQLSAARALARQQSKVLHELESQHPGITRLQRDRAGRIILAVGDTEP